MPRTKESGKYFEVSMRDRLVVAGVAEQLLDDVGKRQEQAMRLIDAVRCCDEFPECSHVLAEYETLERPE